ncbi:MAG: aminotransferase class IV, partial [Candidatus Delongbacteria bacterium]|nr:aminotransferase class IV [Candidatus Delongbacteria bacterium]
ALNYGYGLFETILYENGKIYFFEDHLKRLSNSCQELNIPLPDLGFINESSIHELVEDNGLKKDSVIIKLMYLPITDEDGWNTLIRVNKYKRDTKETSVLVLNKVRLNYFYKHKSLSYMQNHHLLLRSEGHDEILFINKDQNVIEGSYTNVIAIKDNILHFVGGNNDCLFGIMQQNIFKDHRLFGFKKIEALDEGFSKEFLQSCDEVILTNSLKIASNVRSILFIDDKIEYDSCKISTLIRDHYLKG